MSPPEDNSSTDALMAWDTIVEMQSFNKFGDVLAKNLRNGKITHQQFALAVGVSKSTVDSWVAQNDAFKVPGADTRVMILEALDLTPRERERMRNAHEATSLVRGELAACKIEYSKGNFAYVLEVRNHFRKLLFPGIRTLRTDTTDERVGDG